jgi:KaiC/GvpD/RAD55 family RecA-like ATPase
MTDLEFPQNYTSLLVGPPGIGKYEYCLELIKSYLENGEKVIFVTTEKSPEEIKARAQTEGLDIGAHEGESFIFIDIYSYSSGTKYEKGLHVDNPADVNLISINVTKAVEKLGKPVRIFFDSLSTLFLHASENEIKKFFGTMCSRTKTDYGFILYTLQDEMHAEQTVITLKHLVDAVLEMKFEEGPPLKRQFRVHHAKGLKVAPVWQTFEITDTGFEFVEEPEEKPPEKAPPSEVLTPAPAPAPAPAPPTEVAKPKLPVTQIGIAMAVLIIGAVLFQVISPFSGEGESTAPEQNTLPSGVVGEQYQVFEEKAIYRMDLDKTVTVGGEEVKAFIDIKNIRDTNAPKLGRLVIETPFYIIDMYQDGANLDEMRPGPHYLIYDKLNDRDLLVFNNRVDSPTDMLTGSTLGYADLDGENMVSFSSMALHDENGISFKIITEDKDKGFLLVNTEGWDFQSQDQRKGYDVEGAVMFGIFADKPYFIDATELDNLQKQGYLLERGFRDPDEIVKDWVLRGDYDSAVIRGGDPDHLNGETVWQPFYEVQSLSGGLRKSWHAGSASFPKMFPDHVLIGNPLGGGVIFSLPQGRFRFDDSQGIYGGQVNAEFLLLVEQPEKATAFAVDPVNRNSFFYDAIDFANTEGYAESMEAICNRYALPYPGGVIDAHEWETKRFAYVITLVDDWYDPAFNSAKEDAWATADEALADFKNYEDIIYTKMESTKPLLAKMMMTP